MDKTILDKAGSLIEALGYIQRFNEKIVVVKLGGSFMDSREEFRKVLTDIVFMHAVGMRPVVVHGGGKAITQAMNEAGIEAQFVLGRRYTDDRTLAIAEHVLVNDINTFIVQTIGELGGTLVGLATLIQTIYLFRHESRRWVKWTSFTALIMVIFQGLMGGLRVTGHFTLAKSRLGMDPSTPLAIIHGAFGQVFFAVLVVLAAVCSPSWTSNLQPKPRLSAQIGRGIAWTLVGVLLVQLTLGAILRHVGGVLLLHISVAVIVLLLALFSGARAWGINPDQPILKRVGLALLCVVSLQVLLGVCAVIALGGGGPLEHPDLAQAVVTTAHQTTGAVLLAIAVLLAVWTVRLESPVSLKQLESI